MPRAEAFPHIAVRATDIRKRYGGVVALNGVSLTVAEGEVFGIIGPNGAGKSTLFDILCGITRPTSGRVEVLGQDVGQMSPHLAARHGVGRTFQRTAVFGEGTVRENLLYGRHIGFRHSVIGRIFQSETYRTERRAFDEKAEDVLTLCGLQDERDRTANVLAYGVQRRLAIAVALMSDPKILFLDEPAAGMNGRETADFISLVEAIAPGRTVVIVEHDMTVIKALCGRALVVVDGRPVTIDAPGQVFRHPEVISAYLGADDE
ncbi:ABC transporter ATP-binding protein [Bradyrhizobium sp. AS23.2]|uniref:ABC transporter ATP-binding protein n=1 Tax=Bradyrhizobium sp. AS23.2 TaxID=1680155 RepID=UPI0009393BA9|nr:ABC transporter ATP-binding protein [Bradyrhizobium sp. AS23.2]OKO74276.1 branched-chain amino acid ABC transporter ATPase [Bradyrhizobium sp. AS23.2]